MSRNATQVLNQELVGMRQDGRTRALILPALVLLACGDPTFDFPPPARDLATDAGPSSLDAARSFDLAGYYGVLAPAGNTAQSATVDGIHCESHEAFLFHVHAHIAMYVQGRPALLAPGIGVGTPISFDKDGVVNGGSCFAWLHTHDQSGIVHIESPINRSFLVGHFFDIWGQPLSAGALGPVKGPVTAFLNGQPFTGDPATIPLDAHGVIQLDVGTPVVPPQPYTFPGSL